VIYDLTSGWMGQNVTTCAAVHVLPDIPSRAAYTPAHTRLELIESPDKEIHQAPKSWASCARGRPAALFLCGQPAMEPLSDRCLLARLDSPRIKLFGVARFRGTEESVGDKFKINSSAAEAVMQRQGLCRS
jgi:hypothetical protein